MVGAWCVCVIFQSGGCAVDLLQLQSGHPWLRNSADWWRALSEALALTAASVLTAAPELTAVRRSATTYELQSRIMLQNG